MILRSSQPFKSAVLDLTVTALAYKRLLNKQSLARQLHDATPLSNARELSGTDKHKEQPVTITAGTAAAAVVGANKSPTLLARDLAQTLSDAVQPQEEFRAMLASRRTKGPKSPVTTRQRAFARSRSRPW